MKNMVTIILVTLITLSPLLLNQNTSSTQSQLDVFQPVTPNVEENAFCRSRFTGILCKLF